MARQSNFELLRIICMWGVLASHVLQTLYQLHTPDFSIAGECRIGLMNCSIIAVNCFVLISGYFRIKPSWSGFYKLYMQCAFYALGFAFLAYSFHEGSWTQILKSGFALSQSSLWFIRTYIGLYLLAPLLNVALNHTSKSQQIKTLIFLGIIDVYLGYMHQIEEIGINGYNLIHFICLYYAGAVIANYPPPAKSYHYGLTWAVIVFLMVLMHAIKMVFPPIAIVYSLRYNSPFVLLASVVFFKWSTTWKIQSQVINWISASVFSIYLIHCNPFVWDRLMTFLKSIQLNYSAWQVAVLIPTALLLFFLVCIGLDKIRIAICDPIVTRLTRYSTNLQMRLKIL